MAHLSSAKTASQVAADRGRRATPVIAREDWLLGVPVSLTHALPALPLYGLGRPTMSRAGRSPVRGGNGGHVEMAASLISTKLLELISNRFC